MLRTHLTSAINVAHKYSPADLATLGKEWDIDFDSARLGRRSVIGAEADASLEKPLEADVPEMTVAKEYKCGACGYEPAPDNKRPWLALTNHKCNSLVPVGAAQEGVD